MDRSKKSGIKEKGLDRAKLLQIAIRAALYGAAGYACGIARLPFGASPFGVALLAAADRNSPFVYAGLVLSCFIARGETDGAVYLGVYTALILLRALVRLTVAADPQTLSRRRSVRELGEMLFTEPDAYRIMISAIAALGLGACIFFGGGMLYYDLFGLLLSTAAAPAATALLCRGFSGRGIMRELGRLTLFALCVYGANELSIYGVSVALFAALVLSFFVTQHNGIGKGCATALVLGLVYSPTLAPSCVLAAFCLGIFMKLSTTLGLTVAFLSASAWAFYIEGIHALEGIFGAILAATLLYSAGSRLFGEHSAAKAEGKRAEAAHRCRVVSESELDGVRLLDINRRMSAIGEGLSGLAAFFDELKLRYSPSCNPRQVCMDAFESSCTGCTQEGECKVRASIESEAARLAFQLRRNRGLSAEVLESEALRRCPRLSDILDEINYNAGVRLADPCEGEGIRAPDYKALSRLLERGLEDGGGEYVIDTALSGALCEALDRCKTGIDGVAVYGKRRRTVYVRGGSATVLNEESEAILDALEAVLPFSLDKKSLSVRRSSDGGGALTVSESARLSVSSVTRQRIAEAETRFCGDSIATFENGDRLSFSLISDGMGSGREAAAVSEICVRFLESMLSVGRMNGELLSMLSGFLAGRCEGSLCECSATVDLMEVDLISGETVFFKSGAAPTYIYRDGELFKLRSGTMPIGILPDSECRRCELMLRAGDVVVMVSDGVTDGEEECPWLFDLLRQNIEVSGAERTAELIVKYAVAHGSKDDISVVISRLVRV